MKWDAMVSIDGSIPLFVEVEAEDEDQAREAATQKIVDDAEIRGYQGVSKELVEVESIEQST